jgi:hypothetical protein
MDPTEGLRFVVKEALHLKLKGWVVNTKAVRDTDACSQDLRAVFAGVDLQVRSAEDLPRPDTPDVKIVNSRHVPQGEDLPLELAEIDVRRGPLHDREDSAHEWLLRAPDHEEREEDRAGWVGVHPVVDTIRLPDVERLEVDQQRGCKHTDVLKQVAEGMHVRSIEQKIPSCRDLIRRSRNPFLHVSELDAFAALSTRLLLALAGAGSVLVTVAEAGIVAVVVAVAMSVAMVVAERHHEEDVG